MCLHYICMLPHLSRDSDLFGGIYGMSIGLLVMGDNPIFFCQEKNEQVVKSNSGESPGKAGGLPNGN